MSMFGCLGEIQLGPLFVASHPLSVRVDLREQVHRLGITMLGRAVQPRDRFVLTRRSTDAIAERECKQPFPDRIIILRGLKIKVEGASWVVLHPIPLLIEKSKPDLR